MNKNQGYKTIFFVKFTNKFKKENKKKKQEKPGGVTCCDYQNKIKTISPINQKYVASTAHI